MKRAIRSLLLGLAWASIWPGYLVLLAQAARLGPWPRSFGVLISTILHALALADLIQGILAWLTRKDGWAERYLGVPERVARKLCRTGRFLVTAAFICLVPTYLLTSGEIAPEGRALTAPTMSRLCILVFEVITWVTCVRLLRSRSVLMQWFDLAPADDGVHEGDASETATSSAQAADPVSSTATEIASRPFAAWFSRRRQPIAWVFLAAFAAMIMLDARGYSFTARRLAVGGAETLLVVVLAWATHRVLMQIVARRTRAKNGPGRVWIKALNSAAALRVRGGRRPAGAKSRPGEVEDVSGEAARIEEISARLRQLAAFGVFAITVPLLAWVWELDLALVRTLANHPLWPVAADQVPITLGDLTKAVITTMIGVLAWRSMGTLFSLTIFPRITDDPGVRFAIVTLCRYAVLGLTAIIALGAVHLGMAQIGMVLAALGVGLGFGLQEIVSNFVCGIILLLERPIRIGDVVTVVGNTGKVDRINIRATTIINGDNQSMIVPNREFITGNLVNWTHKDKILRVTVKVGVAYGTDPDRVVELLLAIALAERDVLRHPAPSALLEELSDSGLKFALYAFVAEPGLGGGVKHRLGSEIQRRFEEAGIAMPCPTHEVHLCRVPDDLTRVLDQPHWIAYPGSHRIDPASPIPPHRHVAESPEHRSTDVKDRDIRQTFGG